MTSLITHPDQGNDLQEIISILRRNGLTELADALLDGSHYTKNSQRANKSRIMKSLGWSGPRLESALEKARELLTAFE